jgi:hypothetical protein
VAAPSDARHNRFMLVAARRDCVRLARQRRTDRVSVPARYYPKKVRRTFSVDVPDNDEIACGPLPRPIAGLRDLAPAAR